MAPEQESLLGTLRALKPEIEARYKATKIELFGSFSRGEQKEQSDIDLLVDFNAEADLFDLVGLSQFLEDRLGRSVDVVPRSALRSELRESALRGAIPV